MFRFSRMTFVCLFSLMQVIAPLVHAHTGTIRLQGALHLPGLEFLADAKDQSFLAAASQAEGDYGVIVAVAKGIHGPCRVILPQDSGFSLIARLQPIFPLLRASEASSYPPGILGDSSAYSHPVPRAPPAQPLDG